MRSLEKLLIALDSSPLDAVCRGAIGFVTFPAFSYLCGKDRSVWTFVAFLLGVLITLRVVPAVIRRLLPFSTAVQGVWTERRQLAKRYDSYQWRKLSWMGAGMTLNTIVESRFLTLTMVVALTCLTAGALGLARWRALASRMTSSRALEKQVSTSRVW